MGKEEFFIIDKNPLAGGSLTSWLMLLAENGFRISPRYFSRAAYITFLTTLTSIPRIIERKYDKKFENMDIEPVFIIGHFRSGTTYLHYLIGNDVSMGYVSTFHTMVPGNIIFMKEFLKKLLIASLPETRPMDDVKMNVDYPYEEEYALANLSPHSFYHGWYFPYNMHMYFDRYVLFKDKRYENKWKEVYSYFLKKVAYVTGKRRILLKNPPNTARIKQLLDLYPDAKFIHIYRNPYKVFFSTVRLYQGIMKLFALQNYDMKEIEENIFYFYEAMYDKFFREKDLIDERNYYEIRYEDFIKSPLKYLEDMYNHLSLPGFEKSKHRFIDYIQQQKNYIPNKYKIGKRDKERIYERWHLTIDMWGYD